MLVYDVHIFYYISIYWSDISLTGSLWCSNDMRCCFAALNAYLPANRNTNKFKETALANESLL